MAIRAVLRIALMHQRILISALSTDAKRLAIENRDSNLNDRL
jgi:hypothetical protein